LGKSLLVDSLAEKLDFYFNKSLCTFVEVGSLLGLTYAQVQYYYNRKFTKQEILDRKARTYRLSKIGSNNPMFGKKAETHPNFIGDISDGKGYVLCLKPSWYTGRVRTRHIFKHHKVMCQHLGITEIPIGMCVHHIDEDKTNNDLSNLAYMTTSAHARLHMNMHKGVTLNSKEVDLL